MEIDINLSESKIPVYVLVIISLKALYEAFIVTFSEVATDMTNELPQLQLVADGYLWIPMLVFFVYFYLYRKGKMSDTGLKYAIFCVLISIVPKVVLLLTSVSLGVYKNSSEMYFFIAESMTLALLFLYLLSLWYGQLKLKEHHHHHHHHHEHSSSDKQRPHSSDFED